MWRDFWMPQYKYQLIQWFMQQGILTKNKAERMTKKQLYGKYCGIRGK